MSIVRIVLFLSLFFAAGFFGATAPALADCANQCDVEYNQCSIGDPNSALCGGNYSACMIRCRQDGGNQGRSGPTLYGAFAFDPKKGTAGGVIDRKSREAAEADALKACREQGGNNCESIFWFYNMCGAMAIASDGSYGWSYQSTARAAQTQALAECRKRAKDCEPTMAICTGR